MAPTLADIDRYIKARAMAERPGTPQEGATWRTRVLDYEREHPDLPAAAARVEAALKNEEPAIGGDFGEWLRQQGGQPAATPPGAGGAAWFDRLARGFGAGMVAATRALDEEVADGHPLRAGEIDVRIQRLTTRDELVIRVRLRARGARKLRRVLAQRLVAELDAFLGAA